MTKQEIAASVATELLKWKPRWSAMVSGFVIGFTTPEHACRSWDPFESADDDYVVLKHVREMDLDIAPYLQAICVQRANEYDAKHDTAFGFLMAPLEGVLHFYEPGDYTTAAWNFYKQMEDVA